MKKVTIIILTATTLFFGGCTQIVTAPIKLAGAAVSTTLDVAGSAAGAVNKAVTGGDDD